MTGGRGEQAGTSAIVLSVVIIMISVLSVMLVYFAKIRRKSDETKLNETFFREYEITKDIVMNSPLPKREKNSIMEDVLEMLLTGQAGGRTAKEVMGDPGTFAGDILDACISKPRMLILAFIDGAAAFPLFTLFITIWLWLEDIPKGFFHQKIDISILVFYTIISFVMIPAIRRLMVRKKAWVYVIPLVSGFAFIGAVELLRTYFIEVDFVRMLVDGTVLMIPDMVVLTIFIVVLMGLLVARAGNRRLPKR
jgi:hypothetical protein